MIPRFVHCSGDDRESLPAFGSIECYAYFVISQVLLLLVAYLLTRIDWRALIAERKLRWFK